MTRSRARGLVLVAVVGMVGCKGAHKPHDHGASEHPEGHDHHDEGHGHGDGPVTRITRWSERLELFAEHPPARVGAELTILAHLTVLADFRALEQAEVRLELRGPDGAAVAVAPAGPLRPGIFQLAFVPTAPGRHVGRLVVTGAVTDAIPELVFDVAAAAAPAAVAEDDDDHGGGEIELLKEQQWSVPFATAEVRTGTLTASIDVAGVVTTPPAGSAEVGAPLAGRVVAPPAGLPRPGATVRRGQLLALLAPAPTSPEDAARAGLVVAEAEARVATARARAERAARLLADQAVAQREVDEARREVGVADEALRAARRAQQLFAGAASGGGAGSWRLVAPIDGVVVAIDATPGASVAQGAVLFRLIDPRELWIAARVPEQDAARLRSDRDARFQIAGIDDFLPIDLTGVDASASVVTVGRVVDPVSRTVDLIYALRQPDPRLRVGGLVRVAVPAGDDVTGLVVPRSALIDDDGRQVVYLQVDGEHFVERLVRPGPSQGDLVVVTGALAAGDRLVTTGAAIVRLASRAGAAPAHGHIH